MNLSFDQEIQKMVVSESSGTENFYISRSKSENQIGSFDDIPSYEQYHALIKPTQSLVPLPTTSSLVSKKKSLLSGRFGRPVIHSGVFKIGKSKLSNQFIKS